MSGEIGTGDRRFSFWSRVYATHPPALVQPGKRPVRLTYTFVRLRGGDVCFYAGFSANTLTHSLRTWIHEPFPALANQVEARLDEFDALLGTRDCDLAAEHLLIRRRPFNFVDETSWPEAVAWIAGCDATLLAALDDVLGFDLARRLSQQEQHPGAPA